MHKGTFTRPCTISMVRRKSGGSVSLGLTAVTPALTSSTMAPASTWATASASTMEKSPATIAAASFLRPVGLMRSPITQNGLSKPMITSLVAEARSVWVMEGRPWGFEEVAQAAARPPLAMRAFSRSGP